MGPRDPLSTGPDSVPQGLFLSVVGTVTAAQRHIRTAHALAVLQFVGAASTQTEGLWQVYQQPFPNSSDR